MGAIRALYDQAKAYGRIWRREEKGYEILQRKWQAYHDAGEALRILLPFKTHVAYAYSPRENVGSNGADHIVVEEDISQGRLRRQSGDALCRSRKSFWGLTAQGDGRPATCLKCLEIVERLVNIQRLSKTEQPEILRFERGN